MPDNHLIWTREELKTYVLIFCANANFSESKDEKRFIKEKVGKEEYQKMHAEFEKNNDYVSIQKIQAAIEHNNYTQKDKDELFGEIKAMFVQDGETDILEANIFRGLHHIL